MPVSIAADALDFRRLMGRGETVGWAEATDRVGQMISVAKWCGQISQESVVAILGGPDTRRIFGSISARRCPPELFERALLVRPHQAE